MTTATPMNTPVERNLPLLRLMHLVSPSLPIGAFTYSQGIEWAVECGWIKNTDDLADWINGQLADGMTHLDLPVLYRIYLACERDDDQGILAWSNILLANRETAELRAEERQRGRALTDLLISLAVPTAAERVDLLRKTQIAGFTLAAFRWGITCEQAALGYGWAWLESLILAAVKIIPLGQTAGQQLVHDLAPLLPDAVRIGLQLADDEIGSSLPALAIASCCHETQYTRLFRS